MTTPIHRYLDSAVLKPALTPADAAREIQSGIDYNVRSVCVRPADIPLALNMCAGTTTDVGTVLSFPHGCGHPHVKAMEAEAYMAMGVAEIDMVVNYGLVCAGDWEGVQADIAAVTDVARPKGILVKVILETTELEPDAIAGATEAAIAAGADYVKTSTGFASGGASVEAVRIMLDTAQGRIKVKASGGIRDLATAKQYVAMGCERLGVGSTSTPVICDATAAPAATDETY
ncbi:MAG: deoxyribose-phosphate aldolase [Verrucomicrobia bacterium]|jgi:deoxyribose-phosphate aldolase|nr:deoxyribose-phosphate aldolase [Verrucomicrobiota bacterium]MBT7065614.1 deoxyribose-phosphate aldolase [Verrucomicrobiota bacterium]MBT7699393.1 deoxyribose-phosphate aldolase [Verrucomicrobiota bacterium]